MVTKTQGFMHVINLVLIFAKLGFLTPSLPGWFSFKTHVSHLITITLQLHNLPAECARELFKPSTDAASLPVCIKNIEKFGIVGFLWVMS